jgi:hypothetical protein
LFRGQCWRYTTQPQTADSRQQKWQTCDGISAPVGSSLWLQRGGQQRQHLAVDDEGCRPACGSVSTPAYASFGSNGMHHPGTTCTTWLLRAPPGYEGIEHAHARLESTSPFAHSREDGLALLRYLRDLIVRRRAERDAPGRLRLSPSGLTDQTGGGGVRDGVQRRGCSRRGLGESTRSTPS